MKIDDIEYAVDVSHVPLTPQQVRDAVAKNTAIDDALTDEAVRAFVKGVNGQLRAAKEWRQPYHFNTSKSMMGPNVQKFKDLTNKAFNEAGWIPSWSSDYDGFDGMYTLTLKVNFHA
jgi:hypothetical protein